MEAERDALRAEVERLRVELSAAVEAEREECAKVCDERAVQWAKDVSDYEMEALNCAAAIRARGKA